MNQSVGDVDGVGNPSVFFLDEGMGRDLNGLEYSGAGNQYPMIPVSTGRYTSGGFPVISIVIVNAASAPENATCTPNLIIRLR